MDKPQHPMPCRVPETEVTFLSLTQQGLFAISD